jgi:hypothetical protein
LDKEKASVNIDKLFRNSGKRLFKNPKEKQPEIYYGIENDG